MITIEAGRLLTIEATAGETYVVDYDSPRYVDIYNQTSGEIYIDMSGEFKEENTVKHYLIVTAGGFYNELKIGTGKLHIKTISDGKISIVHRGAR